MIVFPINEAYFTPEELIINECHPKWVSFVNRFKGVGGEI
jgi:hypothetical protein